MVSSTQVPVKTETNDIRSPITRAWSPFEEMDRMFEGLFQRPAFRSLWDNVPTRAQPFGGRVPHVDVIDRDGDVLVRAELPGVDRKDLEITTTENMLSIKATTKFEETQEDGDFYRSEIARGAYARTVALPGAVDSAKATATLKNGLLELVLPKAEKARRMAIPVK